MVALEKFIDYSCTATFIDFLIALRILEDVIAGKLVDVVEFYFTLFADGDIYIFIEYQTVVPKRVVAGNGSDFFILVIDAPGLDILVFVD
jgi:hypothetical protein